MACTYTYQGKTYSASEFDDVLRSMPLSVAAKYMPGVSAVPDAPMVRDTKAWVALGIKRAIMHAVDVGADGVVFGTGQQNADLYDLSKQVKHIAWEKNDDGTYNLHAPLPDGSEGIYKEDLTLSEVEDHVGKDIARLIEAGEGRKDTESGGYRDWRIIEGDNLSVGGAGMKAFYDNIVPQVANDVLRKIGGGKVVSIKTKGGKQPGFTITPEMRDKLIEQGMPLFARNAGNGIPTSDAQAVVDVFKSVNRNAPEIRVVSDVEALRGMDEASARLYDEIAAEGALGDVEGAFHDGVIYLFPQNLASVERVAEVLTHEGRHFAFRAMKGRALDSILMDIYNTNERVRRLAKSKQKSLGITSLVDATEEALVDLDSNTLQGINGWKPLFAHFRLKMREFVIALRRAGFDRVADFVQGLLNGWTDADIAQMLRNTDKFVRSGIGGAMGNSAMLSRAIETANGVRVIQNPTREQAINLLSSARYGAMRGIRDPDSGNLYIWDASKAIHHEIARNFGIYGEYERLEFGGVDKLPEGVFSGERGYGKVIAGRENNYQPAMFSRKEGSENIDDANKILAEKYAHAMAQNDFAVLDFAKAALDDIEADRKWFEEKRGVVPTDETNQRAEALAERIGWSVEDMTAMLAQHGDKFADIVGASLAVSRVNIARMLGATDQEEMLDSIVDNMNLMIGTRAYTSEIARALGHYGKMIKRGGFSYEEAVIGAADTTHVDDVDEDTTQAVGLAEAQDAVNNAEGEFNDASKTLDAESAKLADLIAKEEEIRSKINEIKKEIKKVNSRLSNTDTSKLDAELTDLRAKLLLAEKELLAAQQRKKAVNDQVKGAKKALKASVRKLNNAIKTEEEKQSEYSLVTGKHITVIKKSHLIHALGGPNAVRDLFATIRKHQKTPQNMAIINQFMQNMVAAMIEEQKIANDHGKVWHAIRKHVELFKAFILTGFGTHFVNMLSNTIHMSINKLIVDAVAASAKDGVGFVNHYKILFGLTGVVSDILAVAKFAAFDEYKLKQLDILLSAKPSQQEMMLEISGSKWMDDTNKAIGGRTGRFVRNFGFVPLGVEDAIFKVISYRYELAKQHALGQKPNHKAAIEAAKYDTFQTDLKNSIINTQHLRNAPYLQYFFPFVKTLVNVSNTALRGTPLVALMEEDNLKGKHGIDARNRAYGRLLVGAGVTLMALMMASDEDDDDNLELTGFQPYDKEDRAVFLETRQNLGFTIGDTSVSLARFGPYAYALGLNKALYDAVKATLSLDAEHEADDLDDAIGKLFGAVYQTYFGQNWMAGTDELLSSIKSEKIGAVTNFVRGIILGSMIPNLIVQSGDVIDPHKRQVKRAEDFTFDEILRVNTEHFKKRIPIIREELDPILTLHGDLMPNPRHMNPTMIDYAKQRDPELNQWLLSIGKGISKDNKNLDGFDIETRQVLLGKRRELLTKAMRSSKSKGLTKTESRLSSDRAMRKWGVIVSKMRKRKGLQLRKDEIDARIDFERANHH